MICAIPDFKSFLIFLMLKVGIPGLPYLSTVNVTTRIPPRSLQAGTRTRFRRSLQGVKFKVSVFYILKNGSHLPQPCKDRQPLLTCGSCPEGRSHLARVIRRSYIPCTLPFPYGMFNAWTQRAGRVKYPAVPVYPVQTAAPAASRMFSPVT